MSDRGGSERRKMCLSIGTVMLVISFCSCTRSPEQLNADLVRAALRCDVEEMRKALEAGADPDVRPDSRSDSQGASGLVPANLDVILQINQFVLQKGHLDTSASDKLKELESHGATAERCGRAGTLLEDARAQRRSGSR